MTAPAAMDPRADALKMLRECFPEPFYINLWPLTVESGKWSADALIVRGLETRVDLRAYGDTPLAAASALIAAWRAATKPQADRWRECARWFAERARALNDSVPPQVTDRGRVPVGVEHIYALREALARFDAMTKEAGDA